jgi:hypothetical protein
MYIVVHWGILFVHCSAKYTFVLWFLNFCVCSEHVTAGGFEPFFFPPGKIEQQVW